MRVETANPFMTPATAIPHDGGRRSQDFEEREAALGSHCTTSTARAVPVSGSRLTILRRPLGFTSSIAICGTSAAGVEQEAAHSARVRSGNFGSPPCARSSCLRGDPLAFGTPDRRCARAARYPTGRICTSTTACLRSARSSDARRGSSVQRRMRRGGVTFQGLRETEHNSCRSAGRSERRQSGSSRSVTPRSRLFIAPADDVSIVAFSAQAVRQRPKKIRSGTSPCSPGYLYR